MLTDKHGDFYQISEGRIVRLSAAICAAAIDARSGAGDEDQKQPG
jgi:hypothetical protein